LKGESECYETPDVVGTSSILRDARQPDTPDNSEVDATSFSSDDLFKKFSRATLDTSSQDYDHVAIGKPLRQFEYSVNPTGRNVESPLERYQRLRAEVEALASDLRALSEESPSLSIEQGHTASQISKQLENMQGVLSQCESSLQSSGLIGGSSALSSALLKELQALRGNDGEGNDKRVVYELYRMPKENEDRQAVNDMEKRLARLEQSLGSNQGSQKPLAPTIMQMEEKISSLDSNKLKALEIKLGKLSEDMAGKQGSESVSDPRVSTQIFSQSLPPSPLTYIIFQVEELFSLVSKWDNTADQVPLIVERLVSLRDVHEQSANAVETIQQMESDQERTSSLLKNCLDSLSKVNKKIIFLLYGRFVS